MADESPKEATPEVAKRNRRTYRVDTWTPELVAARKAELTVPGVPEGWVKMADVGKACRVADIPVSKLVRATGGDRGMLDPVDPVFKIVFVGRTRYLHPEVMTKGIELLKTAGFATKPRAKKEKAEGTGETGTVRDAKKERKSVTGVAASPGIGAAQTTDRKSVFTPRT